MGPQLDAGQFLRPLDAPRPADRSDFAGAGSANRSEPGGDRFQSIFDDARTTKAPRKAEAPRHGDPVREPASVDRKKSGDAPEECGSSPAPEQASVAPPPTEAEVALPEADGAAAQGDETVASDETQCQALPPSRMPPPSPPVFSLVGATTVDVVPLPPTGDVLETVNVKVPEPADTAVLTPQNGPPPINEAGPTVLVPPTADVADVPAEDSIEPEAPSAPSAPEEQTSPDKRPVEKGRLTREEPGAKGLEVAQIKADPRWHSEKSPIHRPVEIPVSDVATSKAKKPLPAANTTPQPPKGEIRWLDPANANPRNKEVDRAASEEKLTSEQRSVKHRPVTIRSGSGDSAAATVGRFLIETTGEGEPTTANLPSQASERAVSATSTNPTPTRASVERPSTIDVTVTTLSQLLVGGTDGADALEAAAKALSGTQRPGNHHVTLQLDPPELGQLRLDIRMRHQEMTLRVAADTADVARLIESRLAELRDALAVHGIRIDRSEVVVRSHGTENANSQSGQHGGSSNAADGNGTGADTSGAAWSDEGGLGEAPDQGAWDDPPPGPFISYPEPDVESESEWEEGAEGATQEMLVDLVA